MEAFSGVKIVAGRGGLDRKIYHINVMEVPDILDWVREGELLLTTLYSLRDNPAEQIALIPKLAEKKLAALAIKPKRYIDEIPPEALELADKYDFPMLTLPLHVSFSEIMEPLLSEIFDFQIDLLNKSERTHNKLLEVVLRGGGLGQLVEVLAGLVGGEVAIVNEGFEPLTSISSAMAGWLDSLDVSGWKSVTRLIRLGQGSSGLAVPLLAGGLLMGFVLAWHKDANCEFSLLDEITLERAATVAALDIINARAVGEVERRFRNDFVVDVVEGAFPSDEVARQRARTNNWFLHDSMRVMFIRLQDFRVVGQKDRLLRYLRDQFGDRCISGEMGRDIILVAPADRSIFDAVAWFEQHLAALEKLGGSKLLIGVGRDSKSIREIKYSFRQARRAVKTASEVSGLGSIVHYDSLGVYRLLEEMSGKPELQAYIRYTLEPLLEYDKENNTDLLGTLRRYFEAGGNLKQVAKAMYIHYNTVIYRMERIQKLLSVDLDNPHQRLSLEVAVKALAVK
jgi:purine catabolism regulator